MKPNGASSNFLSKTTTKSDQFCSFWQLIFKYPLKFSFHFTEMSTQIFNDVYMPPSLKQVEVLVIRDIPTGRYVRDRSIRDVINFQPNCKYSY